ncbi:alcohol dehydrogenase family protein [Enterovibrio calviensis]|uniref:alcohol dehydrogenase family protein n=1 Tax=Enterovibrio calviensis TaxID=91359 RepID=UPI0004863DEB|nr:alcohol dehydrogenase family protein [Enterovibrio calviensis]
MSDLPKTMHAVELVGHGGPEMLQYREDVIVPTPKSNEVLVKVHAAGVNNTDINTRIGWYSKGDNDSADASWSGNALQLPRIQGIDVCGVIVAVGENIASSRIGERVLLEPCLYEGDNQPLSQPWFLGSECHGGFAEYTVIASRHAYAVNSDLTSIELASFPCSYSTAENMLTRSRVSAKDTVLVSGASGGVGSAAVQLIKARGAKVIAITSPNKEEQLRELGADEVIFRDQDLVAALGSNSVDVVIDLVAGATWPAFLDVLRSGGRYAVSGAIGGPLVELDVRTLYLKDLSFFGCTALEPEVFGNLVSLIETGKIKPIVAQIFPLNAINQAQESFVAKKYVGKLVLTIDDQA